MAKIVGKLTPGLRKLFEQEEESPESHPYQIAKRLLENQMTPLIQKIELISILLKYRLPTLSAQLVQVDDTRSAKPIGRLEIIAALCAASPEERALILNSKKPLQLTEAQGWWESL